MHAIFRCIMQHINALAQPCCGMHWAAKLLYSPTRRGLRFPKRDGCAAAMSSAQGGPHASGPHDVYIHRKAESLLCGGGGGGSQYSKSLRAWVSSGSELRPTLWKEA